MDLGEEYNSLFIRKTVNDERRCEISFEIPTLHMLLLYAEWFVSESIMMKVSALLMEMTSNHSDLCSDMSVIDKLNRYLDDSCFVASLRDIVGQELYDYACSAIGDGEISIPLGLAPSYSLFSSLCTKCRTPKYIRSFCLVCGQHHHSTIQYSRSMRTNKRCKQQQNDKKYIKNEDFKLLSVTNADSFDAQRRFLSISKVASSSSSCSGAATIKKASLQSSRAKLFKEICSPIELIPGVPISAPILAPICAPTTPKSGPAFSSKSTKMVPVKIENIPDVTSVPINEALKSSNSDDCSTKSSSVGNVPASSSRVSSIKTLSIAQLIALKKRRCQVAKAQQIPASVQPSVAQILSNELFNKKQRISDDVEILIPKKDAVLVDLVNSVDQRDRVLVTAAQSHSRATIKNEESANLSISTSTQHFKVNLSGSNSHSSISHNRMPSPMAHDRIQEQPYSADAIEALLDSVTPPETESVPIKLEWPARRMDKYQMSAMRGYSNYIRAF